MTNVNHRDESPIERAERLSGYRWDDPNGNAMDYLLGQIAREMGVSKFSERDDLAVGVVIRDQIQNGDKRAAQDRALLAMLQIGMTPDDILNFTK